MAKRRRLDFIRIGHGEHPPDPVPRPAVIRIGRDSEQEAKDLVEVDDLGVGLALVRGFAAGRAAAAALRDGQRQKKEEIINFFRGFPKKNPTIT